MLECGLLTLKGNAGSCTAPTCKSVNISFASVSGAGTAAPL